MGGAGRSLSRAAALVIAVAAFACREATPPPEPPPREVEAHVWGCASWSPDGACELGGPTAITFVTPLAGEPLTVWQRDRPVATSTLGHVTVEVAPDAGDLVLRDAARRPCARLPVTKAAEPNARWSRASIARKRGALEEAEAILTPLLTGTAALDRAKALGLLGRIARQRGAMDAARAHLEAAEAAYAVLGRAFDRARELGVLAHVTTFDAPDYAAAERAIEALGAIVGSSADVVFSRAYAAGSLARERGDLRTALFEARRACAVAPLRGAYRDSCVQLEANVLLALGRHEEAMARLTTITATSAAGDPCVTAMSWNNLGFTAGTAARTAADPAPLRARAREAYAWAQRHHDACGNVADRALVDLNEAFLAHDEGDLVRAEGLLARARARWPEASAERMMWRALTAGEIAWSAGALVAARASFEDARRQAIELGRAREAWEAELGLARTAYRRGRIDEALAHSRSADARVPGLIATAPLGDGRGAFHDALEQSARTLVPLLVTKGRTAEAMATLRRSHARLFDVRRVEAGLGARSPLDRARWDADVAALRQLRGALERERADDWALPREELVSKQAERAAKVRAVAAAYDALIAAAPAPAPCASEPREVADDEVRIALLADGGTTWMLVETRTGVTAHRLPRISPALSIERQEAALVPPLDSRLARKARVRWVVGPRDLGLSLQALTWRGAPLAVARDVAFSIDLGRCDPPLEARSAVVTGDLAPGLAHAATEAGAVEAVLRGAGWEVERPAGAALSAPALLAKLETPAVGWAHLIGHGRFAGVDGWEATLRLAPHVEITVGDVLALSRAPQTVVLAACDLGRTDADDQHPGLNLAQAFVAAGSARVFAASEPIADDAAAELMARFYRHSTSGDAGDAWRRALRDMHASRPEVVRAYRAWAR